MLSNEIFQQIEKIAATPGKNDKLAQLKLYMNDADFKKVCEYAYNPFKTYGIAKVPEYSEDWVEEPLNEQSWIILDALIARELTGGEAREVISAHMRRLDKESAELFKRIIKKDLRAGFSDSSCNKVVKGMIPEFPYMRCSLPKAAKLDEFDWTNGVVSQEKADGMFTNINVENTCISLTSRQGTTIPMDEMLDLAEDVRRLAPGFQYHGEMLVVKDGEVLPRQIGNGMINSVIAGGKFEDGCAPVLSIWDKIPLESVVPKGSCRLGYKKRLASLIRDLPGKKHIKVIPTKIVHSLAEAYGHYRELLKQGKEGTIIKDGDATWKDGTSKQQVKLKLEFVVDLKIVGYEAGNGKNAATFGSVITESSDGLLRVAVSGFTDAMRQHIHDHRDAFIDSIMAVKANEIMKPSESNELHSLFLPRCEELRTDKSEADGLEQIFAQREAALEAA